MEKELHEINKNTQIIYFTIKKDFPLAVVEAKDNKKGVGAGIQHAISYAEILDVPFAFSSNGDGFVEYDRITGKERNMSLDEFPTKSELWERFVSQASLSEDQIEVIEEPYYYEMGAKRAPLLSKNCGK